MWAEKNLLGLGVWYLFVIPATLEVEVGGSWFEAFVGKVSMKACLKKYSSSAGAFVQQVWSPEFNPWYWKTKQNTTTTKHFHVSSLWDVGDIHLLL
jgi:hypothetical protein